jgi:hypothetical protein
LTAISTTLLVFGQGDVFVFGGQMIVITSAMPLAAWLLSTRTFLNFDVGIFGIGLGLGGGGGFGFSSIEPAFEFPNYPLEAMNFFFGNGFTLDGTLMLSPPIVRLQTQFDELNPCTPYSGEGEKKEASESAKASP